MIDQISCIHTFSEISGIDISGRACYFKHCSCLTVNFVGATWVLNYLNLLPRGTNLYSSPCGITQMQYCAVL